MRTTQLAAITLMALLAAAVPAAAAAQSAANASQPNAVQERIPDTQAPVPPCWGCVVPLFPLVFELVVPNWGVTRWEVPRIPGMDSMKHPSVVVKRLRPTSKSAGRAAKRMTKPLPKPSLREQVRRFNLAPIIGPIDISARRSLTGTGTSRIVHGYTPGPPMTAADAAALGALIKQSQEIGDPGKTVKKAVGKAKK